MQKQQSEKCPLYVNETHSLILNVGLRGRGLLGYSPGTEAAGSSLSALLKPVGAIFFFFFLCTFLFFSL